MAKKKPAQPKRKPIKLFSFVACGITGIEGVVEGRVEYIDGGVSFGVRQKGTIDGKPLPLVWCAERGLIHIPCEEIETRGKDFY